MKRARDKDIAEDIVQEAILKIIKNNIFAKFQGSTEPEFQHYLVRVAMSGLYDYFRKEKRGPEADSLQFSDEEYQNLGAAQDVVGEALNAELQELLQQKIEELPHDYRNIVHLRMMGYSHQEIADIIKRPKGTVDGWMSRAFKILRQHTELKDFLGGGVDGW